MFLASKYPQKYLFILENKNTVPNTRQCFRYIPILSILIINSIGLFVNSVIVIINSISATINSTIYRIKVSGNMVGLCLKTTSMHAGTSVSEACAMEAALTCLKWELEPENYVLLSIYKKNLGSKYPKKQLFSFEDQTTVPHPVQYFRYSRNIG